MPARKTKKNNPRSVMGRLMPPVDVRSEDQLGELSKRISEGPLTLVLIYADWCGHCTSFKPMMGKLETCPGRSVQTARIREDMFPKSSLSSAKIEGYPTLLLVDKEGNASNFKTDSGEVTNAVPDHTNMTKMQTLVRNAGTPQGLALLKKDGVANSVISMSPPGTGNVSNVVPNQQLVATPKNILADRLSAKNVANQNISLMNSASASLREATAPVNANAPMAGNPAMRGGGLWSSLIMASQQMAPAAALFLGAAYINKSKSNSKAKGKGKGKSKTRRISRKR